MVEMIGYASRTGTRRNLAVLRDNGWRLLISAKGVHRDEGFEHCVDNGAWWAHQQKQPFDNDAFWTVLKKFGKTADFVMLPDIVGGGLASLRMSLAWLALVMSETQMVLLPVQDGMTVDDVRPHVGGEVGIFVGGSDAWKECTIRHWAQLAREVRCWCHVGRVNARRRMEICAAAHVTSFDGSGASKFAVHAAKQARWKRQQSLLIEVPT